MFRGYAEPRGEKNYYFSLGRNVKYIAVGDSASSTTTARTDDERAAYEIGFRSNGSAK